VPASRIGVVNGYESLTDEANRTAVPIPRGHRSLTLAFDEKGSSARTSIAFDID